MCQNVSVLAKKDNEPCEVAKGLRELPSHPLGRDLMLGMWQGTEGIRGAKAAFRGGLHTPTPAAQRSTKALSLESKNPDNNRPAQGDAFHLSIIAHLEILTV